MNAAVGAPTIEQRFLAINDVRTPGNVVIPTFDFVDRWETTEEVNIGLTSTMFDERLNVEADYFVRDTENAAVTIILPLIRSNVRRSVGGIRNSGFEMNINWNDRIGNDWSYSIGGNFGTLNNEVLQPGRALNTWMQARQNSASAPLLASLCKPSSAMKRKASSKTSQRSTTVV